MSKLKNILTAIIFVAIFWFFYSEFTNNYYLLISFNFKINYYYLFLSLLFTTLSYLINYYSWLLLINSYDNLKPLTLEQGIAMNASGELAKYLPGRVWIYMMQVLWLGERGYSKSFVVYIAFIQNMSLMLISAICGLSYLYINSELFRKEIVIIILYAALFCEIIFIFFNKYIIGFCIKAYKKYSNIKIDIVHITKRTIIKVQIQQLAFIATFGLGVYFTAQAIGFLPSTGDIISISLIAASANIIGLLVLIVPGGLGVREGVMYFLFTEFGGHQFALIVPIAFRLVCMSIDFTLGGVGVYKLKNYLKQT